LKKRKMKIKTNNWIDGCIREMARKAIQNGEIFEYMIFWMEEPIGWQKKAKRYLQEILASK